jgi:hypothetical protein
MKKLLENTPPPGSKKVAVVLGRFNPPTKGHYELINRVKTYIKAHPELQLEAAPVVVVIGNDKKEKTPEELLKNPLSVHERILFMSSSSKANGVKFAHATNAFEALTGLRRNDMEPIVIAAGTDRVKDYIKMLDEYFKDEDDNPIKHFSVHVARDADAIEPQKELKDINIDDILNAMQNGDDPAIDAVSGSLARRAAELEYEEEFMKIVGLEHAPKLAKNLYTKVRKALASGTPKDDNNGDV